MIRLVIRDLEGGEASFPVTAPVFIGRSRECDLLLKDESVSRKHARVYLDYGDPVVEDLGTPNGTLVNGERIKGAVRLKPGDLIQIANEKIRVQETSPLDDYVATTKFPVDTVALGNMKKEEKGPWQEHIERRAVEVEKKIVTEIPQKGFNKKLALIVIAGALVLFAVAVTLIKLIG